MERLEHLKYSFLRTLQKIWAIVNRHPVRLSAVMFGFGMLAFFGSDIVRTAEFIYQTVQSLPEPLQTTGDITIRELL